MSRPGVLVVGGGIAGSATALAVREAGGDVVLVERERPGARATGASAGMLAPQYEREWTEHPLFPVALGSREAWPAFAERLEGLAGTGVGYRADGMLVACWEPHERRRAAEAVRRHREAGLRGEVLDPADARRLQPGAAPDAGAFLWLPDEAQVDSQRLARALPAALEAAGVAVVRDRARSVVVTGGAVAGVELREGRRLEAGRVVVAAGAWSGGLEGLPRPLPVRPVRGQMLRFPPGAADLRRLLANPGGRYLVPRADGSLLAGSTMEAAGFDTSTTAAGLRAIRNAAARLLPALAGAAPSERWAGLRPDTPDELPILGPDPDVEGLVYATGFGRNGILLGPAAGRAAADFALGREPGGDWSAFRPDRFDAGG